MQASNPVQRCKSGWIQEHEKHVTESRLSTAEVVLIGDSLMRHFEKYPNVLCKHFNRKRILNFGVSGDRTQHVLWRIKFGALPNRTRLIIVHVGTNNVERDSAVDIAAAIILIANMLHQRNPDAQVIITGLLPRGLYPSIIRDKIISVNNHLKELVCDHAKQALFLPPENNWIHPNGRLNLRFFIKINCTSARKGTTNLHCTSLRYWPLLPDHLHLYLHLMIMQ